MSITLYFANKGHSYCFTCEEIQTRNCSVALVKMPDNYKDKEHLQIQMEISEPASPNFNESIPEQNDELVNEEVGFNSINFSAKFYLLISSFSFQLSFQMKV